ncbi:MAG TPA: hypothetical protein VH593_13790 [Ktedonobacteraceae bacterium]
MVIITSYLQSILHFNTYLALTICLIDTIVAALLIALVISGAVGRILDRMVPRLR